MKTESVTLPNGNVLTDVPVGTPYEDIIRKAIKLGMMSEKGLPPNRDVMSGDYWRQVGKNAPGSLARQGLDFVEGITHPVRTFNNIADIAAGGVGNLFDIEESADPGLFGIPLGARDKASAFAQTFKDDYGSLDKAIDTFREDPFGPIGDAASVLTGVGGAAKLATAGRFGDTVAKVGAAIDPLNIAKNTLYAPVRGIQNSAFPTNAIQQAVGLPAHSAQYFLDKGYKLTEESYGQFRQDFINLHREKQYAEAIANITGDTTQLDRLKAEYATAAPINDYYVKSLQAAQKEGGVLRQEIIAPTGVAALGGGLADSVFGTPGVFTGLSAIGALAVGSLERKAKKVNFANWLHQMHQPTAGYVQNDLLSTITQQSIREIGNEETNSDVQYVMQQKLQEQLEEEQKKQMQQQQTPQQ